MLSRRILRWRLAPPFPRPCENSKRLASGLDSKHPKVWIVVITHLATFSTSRHSSERLSCWWDCGVRWATWAPNDCWLWWAKGKTFVCACVLWKRVYCARSRGKIEVRDSFKKSALRCCLYEIVSVTLDNSISTRRRQFWPQLLPWNRLPRHLWVRYSVVWFLVRSDMPKDHMHEKTFIKIWVADTYTSLPW